MRLKINIYSNLSSSEFIYQLFSNYNVEIKKINDLKNDIKKQELGIVFYKETKDNILNIKKISNHFLVFYKSFSSSNQILKKDHSKNIIYIKDPLSIYMYKNYIQNFILNKNLLFEDIVVENSIIRNTNNNLSAKLTDIENEMLLYLIKEDTCTKENIKKEILNIRSDIQTNSLESHLSRIRKKLFKINSNIKIYSKSNLLSIATD